MEKILSRYLPRDLVNEISKMVYHSYYQDVVEEFKTLGIMLKYHKYGDRFFIDIFQIINFRLYTKKIHISNNRNVV